MTEIENVSDGQSSKEQLRSYVERIERLEEEKAALSGDIKSIYDEAKQHGFDVPALREVIKQRKKDPEALKELENWVDTYKANLGMLDEAHAA